MSKIKSGYESLIYFAEMLRSPLLLILRLYWGWSLLEAGLGKLHGIDEFSMYLTTLGIPLAHGMAYLVAWVESVGGLCLLVGFASRLVAIPVIINMCVAYATAHSDAVLTIFSKPDYFIEQSPFLFLLVALLVFAFGPGKLSIDYLIQCLLFKKTDT